MGKCDFSFLAVLLGKRPQNGPKNAIFKNWPKIRPKVINAWIKCLVYHFGGCFAGFLESVLRLGRPKCHFLALENGHFRQNHLSAPIADADSNIVSVLMLILC